MSDNDVLLIPHTYAAYGDPESDNEASQEIHDALPDELQSRVHLIHSEYDQHELKGIIGMCEFFIGSRMHACIAALSQFIPCAALAYSIKFHGVFESVGMENWAIDARHTDTISAIDRVVELYRMADTIRDTLEDNVRFSKDELRRSFREIARSVA
jgi:polysaccharide pyruvyl transferase WcaK-like protein